MASAASSTVIKRRPLTEEAPGTFEILVYITGKTRDYISVYASPSASIKQIKVWLCEDLRKLEGFETDDFTLHRLEGEVLCTAAAAAANDANVLDLTKTLTQAGIVSGSRIVVVLPKVITDVPANAAPSIKSPIEDGLSQRSNKALEKSASESLLHHVYLKLQWQLKSAFFAESKFNRKFNAKDHGFMMAAKTAFEETTLAKLPRINAPNKKRTDVFTLSLNGKYTSTDFNEVEIDCLIKIPVHDGMKSDTIWSKPIEDNSSMSSLQFITNGKPFPLSEVISQKYPQPVRNHGSSSFSDQMYGEGCTHYIVGEAHFPFKKDSNPEEKLIQMERILLVLLSKKKQRLLGKKISIMECVFGVVFMGPVFADNIVEKIGRTVEHYKGALPLLHKLMENKRLLACFHQDFVTTGVKMALTEERVTRLETLFEKVLNNLNESSTKTHENKRYIIDLKKK